MRSYLDIFGTYRGLPDTRLLRFRSQANAFCLISISFIRLSSSHFRSLSKKSAHFSFFCLGDIYFLCFFWIQCTFLASTLILSRAATSSLSIMDKLVRQREEELFQRAAIFYRLVAICRRVFEKLASGLSGCLRVASILLMERLFCRQGDTYFLAYLSFLMDQLRMICSLMVASDSSDSLTMRESWFDYDSQRYSSKISINFFMYYTVWIQWEGLGDPIICLLLQLQYQTALFRLFEQKAVY